MKSRWLSMLALVALAGLALAMAAPADHSQQAATAQSVVGVAAPAAPASSGDPYLGESQFGTEAPIPMVSCQIYAYQCVENDGPCGPNHACACQFRPGTGFICAKVGS